MANSRTARFLAAALMLAGSAVPAAADRKPKWDQALQYAISRNVTSSLDVIIRVAPGGQSVVGGKLASKGRAVTGEQASINAFSATIYAADLADLDDDPLVTSLSLNAVVRAHQTLSNPDAIVALNSVRAMVGTTTAVTGKGVGVAVIDSGLQDRPDLHSQIKAFYDFTVDGTAKPVNALDPYGHGTHIAATIASTGQENNSRFRGVASGARLIGLRVLDGTGNGKTSSVINALAF